MCQQIHSLHARTNVEVLFITCSKPADFLRPYVITTSEHPSQFFYLALGHSVTDVAVHMEAYCISGTKGTYFLLLSSPKPSCWASLPSGVAQTYIQALLQLKKDASAIILNQLHRSTTLKSEASKIDFKYQVLPLKHTSLACITIILMTTSLLDGVSCAKGGHCRNFAVQPILAHTMKLNCCWIHGRVWLQSFVD